MNGSLLLPKPYPLLVNKMRLEPLGFSFWIILFDVLQGCKLFDVCIFFLWTSSFILLVFFFLFSFPFNFFLILIFFFSLLFFFPHCYFCLLSWSPSHFTYILHHLLSLSCYFVIRFAAWPYYFTAPWCFASCLATSPHLVASFHDLLFCHVVVFCLAPHPIVLFHNLLQKIGLFL